MSIFLRLNEEKGISIVFVTHEPDIAAYTRRVIHIRDGMISSDERRLPDGETGRRGDGEKGDRPLPLPLPAAGRGEGWGQEPATQDSALSTQHSGPT